MFISYTQCFVLHIEHSSVRVTYIYLKIFLINFYCDCILSIILNGHNDPCFEDKSLSLTLKYRTVHFSE